MGAGGEIVKFRMGACVLLLGWTSVAQASASWILALPPVKARPQTGDDKITDAARSITDTLDRQAVITEWSRGETFDGPEACEDARLSHLKTFDDAVEATDGGHLSDADRQRLTALAREAFGRCVPTFAFSDGPLKSSR
jgi:hypothetical protein